MDKDNKEKESGNTFGNYFNIDEIPSYNFKKYMLDWTQHMTGVMQLLPELNKERILDYATSLWEGIAYNGL